MMYLKDIEWSLINNYSHILHDMSYSIPLQLMPCKEQDSGVILGLQLLNPTSLSNLIPLSLKFLRLSQLLIAIKSISGITPLDIFSIWHCHETNSKCNKDVLYIRW